MAMDSIGTPCGARVEPGSFRDRTARVFYRDDQVFRGLSEPALRNWLRLDGTRFFHELVDQGKLVATELVEDPTLDPDGAWAGVLRHATIPFVSYPYEWSFGMLREAALLQLELIEAAVDEGMILKDASAFNVQWDGRRPVFIDIPSFEVIEPGSPWVGYEQFCQLFLYPLMLQAYHDIPFHPLLRGCLDGIDAATCWAMLSRPDLVRPGVFKHVFLQSKAQMRFRDTSGNVKSELRDAGFSTELIKANVRGLIKVVRKLSWNPPESGWVSYTECAHYDSVARESKSAFVRRALVAERRNLVWDLGCNTGEYSLLAAEHADLVIAMDTDHQSIDRLHRRLSSGPDNILPLVGNLADPSPALGWKCMERKTLEERGKPDLVIFLALIHHLVIRANIHVDELVNWLGDLRADLVIEFVEKSDPMVQRLLQNKEDLYADYDRINFERCLAMRFEIDRTAAICDGNRTLYYATNRAHV